MMQKAAEILMTTNLLVFIFAMTVSMTGRKDRVFAKNMINQFLNKMSNS
jgi:hypothetical protein